MGVRSQLSWVRQGPGCDAVDAATSLHCATCSELQQKVAAICSSRSTSADRYATVSSTSSTRSAPPWPAPPTTCRPGSTRCDARSTTIVTADGDETPAERLARWTAPTRRSGSPPRPSSCAPALAERDARDRRPPGATGAARQPRRAARGRAMPSCAVPPAACRVRRSPAASCAGRTAVPVGGRQPSAAMTLGQRDRAEHRRRGATSAARQRVFVVEAVRSVLATAQRRRRGHRRRRPGDAGRRRRRARARSAARSGSSTTTTSSTSRRPSTSARRTRAGEHLLLLNDDTEVISAGLADGDARRAATAGRRRGRRASCCSRTARCSTPATRTARRSTTSASACPATAPAATACSPRRREVAGVTAACMLTPYAVFDAVGGFTDAACPATTTTSTTA